ncbi:hypothetical protein [Nonomuraea guangzhouensis]|uniref:Uncharacterized protein n=1 Tax=Nonomuraea guangzhouensis TaxID=1291555 RepID=A0ABW4G6F4_9ACTN|nr:hypothetical protein [Nonomuraea guangzhouensis]
MRAQGSTVINIAYLAPRDCGYGRDPDLHAFCHDHEIGYMLAVPVDLPLLTVQGGSEPVGHLLDRLLAHGNPAMWERRSCGSGTKGIRLYDWAAVTAHLADQAPAPGFAHTVLIRRSVTNPTDIEFFFAHLHEALLRHLVLVMATLAICASAAAHARRRTDTQAPPARRPDQPPPADPGMIPLTIPEIKHLFNAATPTTPSLPHTAHWSAWRRRHQARARWFHKRARLATT